MVSSPFPSASYSEPASLRRRVISFVLAGIANGLLLYLLFTLAPAPSVRPPPENRTVVELLPETPFVSRKVEKTKQSASRAAPRAPKAVAPRAVATTPLPPPPLNMILMKSSEFAAADISKMPSASSATSDADGQGADHSGDSAQVGTAPGGEPLYKAEWFRKPSDADLAGDRYDKSPGVGWGEIACRTAPNHRVEACVEVGQSPPNGGLARVVREASPRFLVRPPRVGGKSLVGTWVLIRIDYMDKVTG